MATVAQQEWSKIGFWSSNLGLLPTLLFGDLTNSSLEQPRILLNGTSGNFILDTHDYLSRHIPDTDPRILAWSSNVGSYVTAKQEFIEVKRWDQRRYLVERFEPKSVTDNIERFHAYLEKQTPRSDGSIIAQTIKTFRHLRSTLRSSLDPKKAGSDALQAFLYLLACAADNVDRKSLNIKRWRLSDPAQSVAALVLDGHWEELILEVKRGRPSENLRNPDLNLLLRHAAGQLFQEAHYEAVFFPQNWLFEDILPQAVDLQPIPLSSTVHFTPVFLVRTLVEAALKASASNSEPLIVFDPACGSGEFLREALRQLQVNGTQRKIHIIGWDISEAACAMANFVLSIEQRDMPNTTIEVRHLNALAGEPWPANVDILLMNPPFVAWENMDPSERSYVADTLGSLIGARPDLSHAFVLKAIASLRSGGVISCVLPASFLTADSAQAVRAQIAGQVIPRLVARLGSQLLFPGALIDVACYIAVKQDGPDNVSRKESTLAFWADPGRNSVSKGLRMLRKLDYWGSPLDYPIERDGYSIYFHPNLGRSTLEKEQSSWNPPPYSSWKLYQNTGSLLTVKDLFEVRRGVQTGNNRAFILKLEQWRELPAAERNYFRPAIVPDSIYYGNLSITDFVFFPYGEYELKSEAELISKLPQYFKSYLYPVREDLSNRPLVKPEFWWRLNRPREWATKPKPNIISNQFGGIGSFVLDMTGNALVINGLSWLAKKEPREDVGLRTILSAYLAILNSSLFSRLLAATSRQLSGGQWQLAKQYVDPIPLPNFFDPDFSGQLIRELASLGEMELGYQEQNDSRIFELLAPLYQLDTNT